MIAELSSTCKSLRDEINELLNFKSKYELMKSENFKLIESNSQMEDHIKSLEEELIHLSNNTVKTNELEFNSELQRQIVIYSEKIRNLESKLEEKENELREERVDTDLKRKRENNLIEEGFKRYTY